jgi:KDO2-lipid IV(A) lauroyltransferase
MDDKRKALLNKFALGAFDKAQRLFLTPDVRTAERRGERLGLLLYRLDKKHRNRTVANLEMAFPEWDAARRDTVARDVFRHWGRVTGDFLRTPLRSHEEVLASMEVEGQELIEAAEAQGRGIIACTAHLGNFERFGHWCTATGRPITVVARDANQGEMQARIARVREASNVEFLSRGDSARAILTKLRRKGLVGLLPDQNTDESFVPFFGKPCGTVLGPAVLGIRTGAVLLPAFCVRVGIGRYRVVIRPPLTVEGREKDPAAIMAEFNGVLESVIRDYPDQYLWMHDRWKSARQRGMLS